MTISHVPKPGYVAFSARATPDGQGGYKVRHTYRKIEKPGREEPAPARRSLIRAEIASTPQGSLF